MAKILVPLMVGALVIGTALSRQNLRGYRRLAARGIPELGTATALEPLNHQFVDYSYQVGGRILSASGRAGFGNPDFCCLHVGDRVSVSYLSDDPAHSCLGNPQLLLRNEAGSVFLAALLFPPIMEEPGYKCCNKYARDNYASRNLASRLEFA
jgi:hypothetical protein